jgi:hypothetical protein
MEDRVYALEETVEQIQSGITQTVDTPEQSDSTESAAPDDEPQGERPEVEHEHGSSQSLLACMFRSQISE